MDARTAETTRTTAETDIRVALTLDGAGKAAIATGVGFFDHMLTLFARHGLLDLTVEARGDVEVDDHHTVEDVGIVLGEAVADALGDKRGITRYGACTVPMDEARVEAVVDISGRPHLVYRVDPGADKVGGFDTCLAREFFQAFTNAARITLHLDGRAGDNAHHILEAAFKATGRALRAAVSIDPREQGVPSSKGTL